MAKFTVSQEIASTHTLSAGGDRPALLSKDGGYSFTIEEFTPEKVTDKASYCRLKLRVAQGEDSGKVIYHTVFTSPGTGEYAKPPEVMILAIIGSADPARYAELKKPGVEFDSDVEFQRLVGRTLHGNCVAYVDKNPKYGTQIISKIVRFVDEENLKPRVAYADAAVTAQMAAMANMAMSGANGASAPSNGAVAVTAAAPSLTSFLG